jgi:ABC-type transport system substrate-binding protein
MPFSARDVVFTFDLMRRVPALDRQKLWSFLADVAAADPGTVEFTLKRPYTPGLVYVGQQPIVPEHRWKSVAQPASFDDPDPVGTGPFTQVLRFEATFYDLGRNPKYWQSGKPGAAGLARGADGTRAAAGSGPMRYEINVVQGWTDWIAAAGIIQQNLAEIGVAASVKPLEYNRWLEALKQGRFDLSLGFGSRGPTPYQFYRGQMDGALVRPVGEEAVDNYHRFASAEAAELLRRYEATADASEQTDIARQLQRLYVTNAPSLPLFASPLWGVFNSKRFSGFPSRFLPYAGAAPGGQADSLPVLIEVKPR